MSEDNYFITKIVNLALEEDLYPNGDITSYNILTNEQVDFTIKAREEMLVSGISIVELILKKYPEDIQYKIHINDADYVQSGGDIITGRALAKKLMSLERIVLNFLQYCSGISSYTKEFVEAIKGTKVIIRSTRKTAPGLRRVEKYAVKIGGGENYRMNLSDEVLIKDNHIASCGDVKKAILKIRKNLSTKSIAIECDNLIQVKEACELGVDLILLDNMSLDELKKSVEIVDGKIKLEASGGVNINNVFAIANTGVDYVSVGAITHSFANKDIALDIIY